MSKAAELAGEFAYPLTRSAVLIAMLMFFLLIEFALSGGVLGTFLLLLVLPALLRYLLQLLEARARGVEVGTPGIETFSFFDNVWSLFPVVLISLLIAAGYLIAARSGITWAIGFGILCIIMLPACLAVLAITHAPLESLTPRAVIGLIRRCGVDYWLLAANIIAAGVLAGLLRSAVTEFVSDLIGLYLLFALFALTGGILRRHDLTAEIDIPAAPEPDDRSIVEARNRERQNVLNHAYGMISRANRRGGLAHIFCWLEKDSDPDAAWRWFFGEMLRWETREAALVFAQHYLSRLLQNHEFVPAVKVMMRCREIDAAFRPLPDDRPMALAAAEHCHNDELVAVLK